MARLQASEYGGTTQRNGIAPPITPRGHKGHAGDVMPAHEKLRLIYMTGQDEDTTRYFNSGEAFAGLLPVKEQEALMPTTSTWADENA